MDLPIYGANIDAAYNEAKRLRLKRYKSGRTCYHGHENPERYTINGRCVTCSKVSRLNNKKGGPQ